MLQHAFWDYLSDVRASPARPFLHYNSWFDFYSWQEPNKTFAHRAMDERSVRSRSVLDAVRVVRPLTAGRASE